VPSIGFGPSTDERFGLAPGRALPVDKVLANRHYQNMLKRLLSIVRKEFIQIRRDRRTLAMMIAIPVLWIVIFGYAATFDVQGIRTVVAVPADSPTAALIAAKLDSSEYFTVVEAGPLTDAELEAAINERRASVAIRPPGTGAPGLFIADGSDLFTAQAAARQIQALVQSLAQQTGTAAYVEMKILYNPNLRSVNYMIPGLVGVVMVFIATMMTAVAIVRERERGTLEQLLVTPVSPVELMLGKIIPYMVIAFADFLLVMACGVFIFHVPFAGNPGLLMLLSLAFLFVCLGMGLLVSTVSQTQQQAMQMAVFTLLPQILLSGFIFPLAAIPWAIRWIAYLAPLTYFLPIARGTFLRGEGIGDLWLWAVILVGYAVVIISLAVWRFRRKLV
jgi:ABC-2 type transport system permease protein